MQWHGIPREKIPWYPGIDYEKCQGCQECYNFCPNDVYEWDKENEQPLVKNPYNCVIGCSSCKNLCENDAISFSTMEEIRKIRDKLRKD